MPPFVDFRALFEHSPNPYLVLDPQLRCVAANDAYLQVTGMRLEELIARSLFEVFPHDPANPENESAALLRQSLERVLATGQPDVLPLIRYRVPRRDDGRSQVEDRFWSATHTPILAEDGSVACILQHTVDVSELQRLREAITQQKIQEAERDALLGREREARADAELAEARQRFLAESIPQQVWTAQPDGELDFVSRRVLDYFGLPEAEMLGSGWREAVHPDDLEACAEQWSRSLETGDEYECQFRLRRADGTYRWHLARALALRAPDGRIAKWFGTNTDMDELTRARHELDRRAEFDQQLIGIVSHDLRNPLNAIGIAASLLLRRGYLDEQSVRVVKRITSSADRATRLIRDFLDFTQARVMGRLPVSPRPANIREIARQAFDEVVLTQQSRRGTIAHEGEESGIWDPDRLAQVIGNLLSNAFQHSPASSVVRLITRGNQTVTIEVHNEGSPIPPDDLARLFDPFERGTDARASGRSIGLGLYISRQIVEAHGGTIDVQSREGEGTTFTVRLPRVATPIEVPAPAEVGKGL